MAIETSLALVRWTKVAGHNPHFDASQMTFWGLKN